LVVIFWCDHASRSDEVAKEWKAAIEQQKDLLPLLLDATPLPSELGEFQWIDFRETVGPHHGSISGVDRTEHRTEYRHANRDGHRNERESMSAPRRGLSSFRMGLPFAAVFATLIVAGLVFNVTFERGSDSSPAPPEPVAVQPAPDAVLDLPRMPDVSPTPAPDPPVAVQPAPDAVPDVSPMPAQSPGLFDFLFSADTLIGLALIVTAISVIWVWRRRSYRATSNESVAPYPSELEQRIAAEVETEILRRTHRSN
jgi:hypothetical protein